MLNHTCIELKHAPMMGMISVLKTITILVLLLLICRQLITFENM